MAFRVSRKFLRVPREFPRVFSREVCFILSRARGVSPFSEWGGVKSQGRARWAPAMAAPPVLHWRSVSSISRPGRPTSWGPARRKTKPEKKNAASNSDCVCAIKAASLASRGGQICQPSTSPTGRDAKFRHWRPQLGSAVNKGRIYRTETLLYQTMATSPAKNKYCGGWDLVCPPRSLSLP